MKNKVFFFIALCISLTSFAQQARMFPYYLPLTGTSKPPEIEEYFGSNAPTLAQRYTEDGLALTFDEDEHAFTGFALSNLSFTSNYGIEVEFKYAMIDGKKYNGNYGDGLSMFLYDSDKPFQIGGQGASLGYVYRNSSTNADIPGLNGAYLGVGLDLYGDFKTRSTGSGEKKEGIAGGTFSNRGYSHITIRGGSHGTNRYKGYPVLYSTATRGSWEGNARLDYDTGDYELRDSNLNKSFDLRTGYDREGEIIYHTVKVMILPNPSNTGSYIFMVVKHPDGVSDILYRYYYSHAFKTKDQDNVLYNFQTSMPANFKVGFAAGTGGATQTHLVKDVVIRLPYSPITYPNDVIFCIGDGDNKDRNVSIDPYRYTYFYRGEMSFPIGGNSADNIDFDSFRFEDEEGYPLNASTPYKHTVPGVGIWEYQRGSRKVKFTATTNNLSQGEYSIYYSAKGHNKPNMGPFGDEVYRSQPTKLTVIMKECERLVNPLIPVRIEVEEESGEFEHSWS